MSWRYRRSLRLAKGVRINLGKRGASLSIGGHGVTSNYNVRGTRTSVSVPGTGLSYSTRRRRTGGSLGSMIIGMLLIALALYACARL